MRIIDGRTIETECDSCACTFTTTRGEDGEPDEILCPECKQTWQDLRAELAKERDRVFFETFLSFPFKALPAPCCPLCDPKGTLAPELSHIAADCPYAAAWRIYHEERGLSVPAADRILANLDWADQQAQEAAEWREHQDLMDAADQAAYYSPKWEENR